MYKSNNRDTFVLCYHILEVGLFRSRYLVRNRLGSVGTRHWMCTYIFSSKKTCVDKIILNSPHYYHIYHHYLDFRTPVNFNKILIHLSRMKLTNFFVNLKQTFLIYLCGSETHKLDHTVTYIPTETFNNFCNNSFWNT